MASLQKALFSSRRQVLFFTSTPLLSASASPTLNFHSNHCFSVPKRLVYARAETAPETAPRRDNDTTVSPSAKERASERPAWAQISCQSPPKPRQKTPTSLKALLSTYIELSKPRLTALVVLSTMSSYALAPGELTVLELLILTAGTALCSASANSINMAREPEYDAQMTRTRTRPVPAGKLTSKQAFGFAALTGVTGTAVLVGGINPTVGILGAANIALYGGLYTTLKRKHIVNTWVGAVVGAIPPLMGWGACSSLADPGAWLLAGLLYSWQFPHFMSLSYSIADEYKRAGYIMSAWTNPLLTARVALRHAIAMFPLCIGLSYVGVCDWFYALDSSIVNGWLVYTSYNFWKQQKSIASGALKIAHSGEHRYYARQLFWASVIHLPAVLILAMVHKNGMWDNVFTWLAS